MGNMQLLKEPKRRKPLFSAGASWMFDAMDVGMISFVVAALAAEWSLSSQQVGILTSTTSIGMVFGAAMAGFLADKYGRKNVLLWTLLIFSIASGLSALATGFIMLCLIRFIAGFGLGGELPVASTLVSESMPVHERGRAVVFAGKLLGGRLDTIRTHCLLRHPGLRLADSLCYWSSACFLCALSAACHRGFAKVYRAESQSYP